MVMVRSFRGFAKCTSLSVIGLLVLFVLPRSLRGQQTIHVPADQATIQAAINAASNGGTVLVAPGTYFENINFKGKAITVTSSGGPSVTIIDGSANGSVVTFNSGETTSSVLSGFTIRNGQSNFSTPGFGSGGGIFIHSSSPTIGGNVITGNHAVDGIGIFIDGGTPVIQGNTITGNTQCCGSGSGGGGIEITAGTAIPSVPQIVGNLITNNSLLSGGDGGGIYLNGGNGAIIRSNFIQGNVVFNGGGGVSLINGGSVSLIQNVIVNNSTIGGNGGSGGGLFLEGPSSSNFTIVGNTIVGNTAFDNTSGVYISVISPPFPFTNNIVVAAASQTAITCSPINGALSPNFSYNDVYSTGLTQAGNCDFTTHPGNISSDPLFMSAANGDFHLMLGSAAIDAGDNSAPSLPTTDFDGNPRIVDGNNDGVATIDLGAYEVGNSSAAAIAPNSLSFSPQVIGTTSIPQSSILSSIGTTPFQITSVQTTSGYAQTNTCPVLGAPGSAPGVPNGNSCSFSIAFAPPSNGLFGGLLIVNGTNGTSLLVSLSGTGFTPAPAVSLSPASVNFSPQIVGTTSAPQPVTLANTGTASLSVSSISASQPFAQTNNCPAVLAAAANCTINVTFKPIVSGNATGTLTIVDNASGSPQTVNLSGTGNPVPQPVAITLVQHVSKDAGTTTFSSVTFPSNNAAGNWIGVAIRAGHSGQSFTVKDSNGNTYHQAAQFNVTADAPNGDTLGIFCAENIAGGPNKVTVSDTISGTLRIAVLEYSGVASANSLDATAAAQGSSSAPNSGNISTSANGDLLLGVVLTGNGENFTGGSAYLIEERVPAEPNTKLIVEDQVQPASGTASAAVSLGASDNWGAAVAAFKSATTSVSTSPTITSLTPALGAVGTAVTVTGTNFGATQGTSTVTFNGTPATPTSWSATAIVVPVPAGATTGNVVVTLGGVASNGVVFTVIAPMITRVSPSFGPVGASVMISGTNFGATQGTSTVTFVGPTGNLATATPTSWSDTSIVVPVPAGATTGTVGVVVGLVGSNSVPFTVTPTITQVYPNFGPAGTSVGIYGTNFGTWVPGDTVTFNGTAATIQNTGNWIDTGISVSVPSGATTGPVVVAVGGFASNSVNFTVTPVTISSLNPTSGPAGTPVTITGTNFGPTQGTSLANIGGVTATPTSWSQTSIVAPVPTGATTGSVTVTVGVVTSNALTFTVASPSITSLSANNGPVGTPVTITGTNFGASQGTSTVTFNGVAATPASWGATSIVAPVPTGATNGNVVVTVGGVASNGVYFAPNPPNISALNPTSGRRGTSLTITGTYFGASQGTSTVSFAGIAGTPTSWSDTSITVPVPAAATFGNDLLWLVVHGVGSNQVIFTVISPSPSISNLSPSAGLVGTSVIITGTNFGATQGASTVAFNGTAATPTSWSDTSIVAPVPTGATTGNVVVTVGGLPSNGFNFTVAQPPPSITSLNPTSGAIGTPVTITGANFGGTQGTSTVTFNGTAATPTSWSATSIVVPVPAGATTGNVVVTVGGQASNGVPFTVNLAAPSIALVQHTSKDAGTTSSSTLAFNANNAAGNFIAVVIRAGKSGQAFSVSDSRGNVYKQAIQFNMTVDAETLGIFYAESIAGGANTVTVSDTILGTMRFAILEYSGVAASNSLDVTFAAQGTSASPSSGSVTTASSGDLLLGAIVTSDSANFTAGNGYTIQERVPVEPNTKLIVEDQRQTIAGTASAGASLGASVPWGAGLAAFRHP